MMRAAALLVMLLAVSPAWGLDVRTEDYRAAASARRVGAVSGRAFQEARRRHDPDTPLGGFDVTLVPRSQEFLDSLARIRDESRTDMSVYRSSAGKIASARRDYERALSAAGSTALTREAPVTADGEFHFDTVPAGEWLVIALRPVFVPKSPYRSTREEKDRFAPQLRLKGFYAVSVWVREVTVGAGRVAKVTLTDRNVWMTAIHEERVPDAGR